MTKTLSSLKRGYIYKFIYGIMFVILLGALLMWAFSKNTWWSWTIIIVIGPTAFLYTIKQIPSEFSALKRILGTSNVEEYYELEEKFGIEREAKGKEAARGQTRGPS